MQQAHLIFAYMFLECQQSKWYQADSFPCVMFVDIYETINVQCPFVIAIWKKVELNNGSYTSEQHGVLSRLYFLF